VLSAAQCQVRDLEDDELLLRGFKILGQLADQRCSASIQVLPQSH
jgi:hypothetical protein